MRSVRQAAHLPEATASIPVVRAIETRTVEGVEGFQANLEPHVLRNCELLPHRKVDVVDTLRKHIVEITRSVAELLVAGVGEAPSIEHAEPAGRSVEQCSGGIMITDAGTRVRA